MAAHQAAGYTYIGPEVRGLANVRLLLGGGPAKPVRAVLAHLNGLNADTVRLVADCVARFVKGCPSAGVSGSISCVIIDQCPLCQLPAGGGFFMGSHWSRPPP